MTAIAERRRRRTWYALGAGVLVVAAIPVLSVAGWRAIRDSKAAHDVTSTAQPIPVTPTALLGGVDAEGQLTTLAMLAMDPDGAGGTIVSLPVGASVADADGVRRRLADGFAEGGVDELRTDVESMMLVTIDVAQVVDEAQLAALLTPVGEVSVDLPADVLEGAPPPPPTTAPPSSSTSAPRRSTTTTSTTVAPTTQPPSEVVAPAGAQQLPADGVAQVLLASVAGASETTRMPTHLAMWKAVAAAVGTGRPGVTPVDVATGGPTDLTAFTNGLWAGPINVWQLGVTPITSSIDNPSGSDLLQIDIAESILVVASIAPSAISAVLDGAAVQITTGFTDWRVTRNAIAVLVYIGANVMVVTNTTDAPPATTSVLAGSAAVQGLADEYAKALNGGPVEAVKNPVEGIEVQIVLGQSFADAQPTSGATEPVGSMPTSPDTIDENAAADTSAPTTVGT